MYNSLFIDYLVRNIHGDGAQIYIAWRVKSRIYVDMQGWVLPVRQVTPNPSQVGALKPLGRTHSDQVQSLDR